MPLLSLEGHKSLSKVVHYVMSPRGSVYSGWSGRPRLSRLRRNLKSNCPSLTKTRDSNGADGACQCYVLALHPDFGSLGVRGLPGDRQV